MAKIIQASESIKVQEKLNKWATHLAEDKNLLQYFINEENKTQYGFEVGFYQYLELVNSIGTSVFKMRFGLVEDPQKHLKFALFLWGENKSGGQTTPFVQLDAADWIKAPSVKDLKYNDEGNGQPSTTIPALLAYSRYVAWESATSVKGFPFNDLFKVENYATGLKGYTYQREDFISVLTGFDSDVKTEKGLENIEDGAKIRFSFNCLGYDYKDGVPQNGYFDILILAVIKPTVTNGIQEEEVRGLFSDTGAPCPPTCGDN